MQALHNQSADVRRRAAPLIKGGMSLAEAVEEVIVDIPSAQLVRLKGWRAVVGKVRDALARAGMNRAAALIDHWLSGHLTEQQRADLAVADLVRAARAWVARKPGRKAARGATALSTGKLADDLAAQEAWLTDMAKAAGFASIEDMLEKDYGKFEALAQRWREEHPAEALLSRAWHGGAAGIESFRSELVGTGDGADTFGWGAYFASLREVAEHYKEQAKDSGKDAGLYEVEIPDDDGRYLTWERPLSEQSASVKAGLSRLGIEVTDAKPADSPDIVARKQKNSEWVHKYYKDPEQIERTLQVLWRDRADRGFNLVTEFKSGKDAYLELATKLGSKKAASMALRAEGVAGVKFLDATKPKVDSFNYTVFDPESVRIEARLSRAMVAGTAPAQTATERAESLIQTKASTPKPIDTLFRGAAKAIFLERLAAVAYGKGAALIERLTPERVKAGIVSDYGVPEAVIDQRAALQGSQREQLR
jgi:hypothetical protein